MEFPHQLQIDVKGTNRTLNHIVGGYIDRMLRTGGFRDVQICNSEQIDISAMIYPGNSLWDDMTRVAPALANTRAVVRVFSPADDVANAAEEAELQWYKEAAQRKVELSAQLNEPGSDPYHAQRKFSATERLPVSLQGAARDEALQSPQYQPCYDYRGRVEEGTPRSSSETEQTTATQRLVDQLSETVYDLEERLESVVGEARGALRVIEQAADALDEMSASAT